MFPLSSCIILGTDTDAGKTYISQQLLRLAQQQGLRAVGMKPVATGWDSFSSPEQQSDILALASASSLPLPPVEDRCPYLFAPPAAPHLAARQEGIQIDPQVIQAAYQRLQQQADCIIVESAGGVLSPLNDTLDMADLPRLLNLPAILVIELKVGCINQGRLAAEALTQRHVPMLGWIANLKHGELLFHREIMDTLQQAIPFPLLSVLS
jgi:dethiobiotin synthetase